MAQIPAHSGISTGSPAVSSSATLPIVTPERYGAKGDGVTDDSAAFNAVPANVIVQFLHSNYFTHSHITPKPGQVWQGYGVTITTDNVTDAVFYDETNDGTTFKGPLSIIGVNLKGSNAGGSAAKRTGVWLNQWTDVFVIGGSASTFADSAYAFRNCERVNLNFTTHTNISFSGGTRNALIFGDAPPAGINQLNGWFMCVGNTGYGAVPTANCSINASFGGYSNLKGVIANNNFATTNGTSNVFSEVNSYNSNTSESFNRQVIISNNLLDNQYAGASSTNIYALDDAATYINDPLKLSDHVITGNFMTCANGSGVNTGLGNLFFFGSRFKIADNLMLMTGTGHCVLVKPNTSGGGDPTIMQDVSFTGNHCFQTNTQPLNAMVEINNTIRWHWLGGSLTSSCTAQSTITTADGFKVGGGCQYWTIGGDCTIENAGNNAVNVTSWKDGRLKNLYLHNPNACNAATTSAGNGICVQGSAMSGSFNLVENVEIVDDRGTHQMLFGMNCGTTATTKAIGKNLTIRGALSGTMTSTTLANFFSEISGFSSDVMTGYGFNATAPAIGASPFTSTAVPYDQLVSVTGGTVSAVSYSRNSVTLPTAGQFYVRRGETITVTYTVAPTLALVPLP